MPKNKKRVIVVTSFLCIAIIGNIYLSTWLHLVLKNNFTRFKQLKIANCVSSLIHDNNHQMLYIALIMVVILACVAVVMMERGKENYFSELVKITDKISTPISIGQGQHGSAKWMNKSDYDNAFQAVDLISDNKLAINKGGIVVNFDSINSKERIYFLDDDVHSCTIGATRSGKTRSIVLQSIVLQALAEESMVCSDPKGELYQFTYPFLEKMGYQVIAIDFKNPLKSSKYNFLQPIIDAVKQNDLSKAVDLTWDIAEALVGESKGEKIWSNGEKAIMAGAIMSVVFDNKKRPQFQNMSNVYYFILEMCKTVDDTMLITQYLAGIEDDHPARGLFGVAEVAPPRTRGSFFTAALSTLRLFTNANIYSMTNESNFNMQDTGAKKQAIFIILPDERQTFYSLASLFVYQHYVALVQSADKRGGRLERRVNYNLDEFANFTSIPGFENMLTVGGGRGMRFNIFLQSFAQLEAKYGKDASQTIKDNCHAWIYLKTANGDTAELISKKLGNYTTSSFSKSNSYSSGANKNFNSSSSMNLISRPLLTSEEIQRIERPYILVMIAGEYPAITTMPDLSEWSFNELLGLGDEEHNRLVRQEREEIRPSAAAIKIKLWGVWNLYNGKDELMEKYLRELENERIENL